MSLIEKYRKKIADLKKTKRERQAKKRLRRLQQKNSVEKNLQKAGMYISKHKLSSKLFNIALVINIIISGFIIYFFSTNYGYPLTYVILMTVCLWILIFFGLLFIVYLTFYLFLDLKILQRKLDIEEVLPDFLQLTSANIRGGMPIDKALWFAVRPRFGVLAKEIEIVAKEVISGEELSDSLQKFADKYSSDIVKRSINLMIEGLEAGGEVGDLLNKISTDIQEARIMRKEMSADVMTYVIFISFASVIAAPLLMALSYNLLSIIYLVIGKVAVGGGAMAAANMPIQISKVSVQPSDFMIFSIVILTITAFFSSLIVAIIQKGSISQGLKYIPAFIFVTISIFLVMSKVFSAIMSGFF
jgi:Flp pilus assembly protein TadB